MDPLNPANDPMGHMYTFVKADSVQKKTDRAVGELLKHRIDTLEEKIVSEEHPTLKNFEDALNEFKYSQHVANFREYLKENEGPKVSIWNQLKTRLKIIENSLMQSVYNSDEPSVLDIQLEMNQIKLKESLNFLDWTLFQQVKRSTYQKIHSILDSKMSKRRELTINNIINIPRNLTTKVKIEPYLSLPVGKGNENSIKLKNEQATYMAMMGAKYLDKFEKTNQGPSDNKQVERARKVVKAFEENFGNNYVDNFMDDLYDLGNKNVRDLLDFQQATFSGLQVSKNIYVHELYLEMNIFYRAARTFEFSALESSKLIPLSIKQFVYSNIANKYISPIKAIHQEVVHTMREFTYGEDWFDKWTNSDIPEQSGEFLKKYRTVFPVTFDYWTKQVAKDMESRPPSKQLK